MRKLLLLIPATLLLVSACQYDLGTPAPAGYRTVAWFGDSTADFFGQGFHRWTGDHDTRRWWMMANQGNDACPLLRVQQTKNANGDVRTMQWYCNHGAWVPTVQQYQPQVAIILAGVLDAEDVRPFGWSTFGHFGQPDFDAWARADITATIQSLLDAGVQDVVLLSQPPMAHISACFYGMFECTDGSRNYNYNVMLYQIANTFPGNVHYVDYSIWTLQHSSEDGRLRPDGIHTNATTAAETTDRFLVPALDAIIP